MPGCSRGRSSSAGGFEQQGGCAHPPPPSLLLQADPGREAWRGKSRAQQWSCPTALPSCPELPSTLDQCPAIPVSHLAQCLSPRGCLHSLLVPLPSFLPSQFPFGPRQCCQGGAQGPYAAPCTLSLTMSPGSSMGKERGPVLHLDLVGGHLLSCLAWREGPKGTWQGLGGRCPQLCGAPPQHAPTGCAVHRGGTHHISHFDRSLSAVMTSSESSWAPGLSAELVRGI